MNILNIIKRFKKAAEPNATMLSELAELQKRNETRIEAIKKSMGSTYLLHPDNIKSRLDEPRPV